MFPSQWHVPFRRRALARDGQFTLEVVRHQHARSNGILVIYIEHAAIPFANSIDVPFATVDRCALNGTDLYRSQLCILRILDECQIERQLSSAIRWIDLCCSLQRKTKPTLVSAADRCRRCRVITLVSRNDGRRVYSCKASSVQ